jgi:hypothetical protein
LQLRLVFVVQFEKRVIFSMSPSAAGTVEDSGDEASVEPNNDEQEDAKTDSSGDQCDEIFGDIHDWIAFRRTRPGSSNYAEKELEIWFAEKPYGERVDCKNPSAE